MPPPPAAVAAQQRLVVERLSAERVPNVRWRLLQGEWSAAPVRELAGSCGIAWPARECMYK